MRRAGLFTAVLVLTFGASLPPLPLGAAGGQPAARYGMGDDFDLNAVLLFGSDGRYAFHWHGCKGTIAESSGQYIADDRAVTFRPDSTTFRRDPRTFADSMRRITWGQREYLIAEERMLAFVNAVNSRKEPRPGGFGLFYLRDGDDRKPADGVPDVGVEWAKFILRQPLTGSVLRVEQRETSKQRRIVVIDAGASAGLRAGMTLYASNPRRPYFYADLTIVEVEENRARVSVPFQYNHIRVCDVWHSQRGAAQQPDDERRVAKCLRAARS
jgi:hypothetical protein